jgi:putative ABC transport system permease protein
VIGRPRVARRRRVDSIFRGLSRLAPRWRRDDWLGEWLAEIEAAGATRIASLVFGAFAHVVWLWRHEWSIDMIGTDVRYALRTILRRPAFALTVTMTIAVGIGATTAMFTIVDAVLLRALPFPQADRVAAIWPRVTFSPHELDDAQRPRDAFEAIGAYSGWGFTLTGGTAAEAIDGARITPQLLPVLGVQPIVGRWFDATTVQPGRDRVALIGEGLWRRRFGGDPAAVGGRLMIEGEAYTVVGVMPASFEFPARRSEIWAPITIDPSTGDYNANFAQLIGRVTRGVSVEAANSRMRVYADELHRSRPKEFGTNFLERAVVVPLQSQLVLTVQKPLWLLLVAVGVLLIIACANTAHLLLARSGSREGEIAIRAALGATRPRIIRQLLVESLVLAIAGGAAGILFAHWLVGVFLPFVPDLPQISRAAVIDPRVMGFTVLVVLSCATLFGLTPALQASRTDVHAVLGSSRGGGRSPRRARIGRALVWAEVALATTLVVSAALLGRSYVHLTAVDLGFAPDRVLTLRVSAPEFRYREDDQLRVLFDDVLQRLRRVPGVVAVGAIHLLPLTPDNWNPGVRVDGVPEADQYQPDVNWRVVTPDYFRTMGIPTRTGRLLTDADDQRATPVAIVNDAFVHAVFHDRSAVGQRIRTGFEAKGTWTTVVGVVGDVRQHSVDQPSLPEIYRPFAQHPLSSLRVMVRVTGEAGAAGLAARAAVAEVDRDIAIADLQPLAAVVDHALGGAKLPLILSALFSTAAMALGVIGVAGILSFDVAERRAEIGLRLALGARPAEIRRQFLARGLRLGVAGVAAGSFVALGVGGVLRSLLFGVSPTDPATIVAVSGTFVLVIAAGAYIPARAASRVDPLNTLRT